MEEKKLLSKPWAGWAHFNCNEHMRISYIDDMPIFMLDEIVASIEEHRHFLVTFDAEGYEYSIVSYDRFSVECILRTKETPEIIVLPYTFEEFISQIILDIKNDIDDWVAFSFDTFFIDEQNKKNINKVNKKKQEILQKINKIENLKTKIHKK